MGIFKHINGSASDQEVDPKTVDVVLVRRSSAGRAGTIFYGVPLDAYWQSKIAAGNAKILPGVVLDEPREVFDNEEDFIASLEASIEDPPEYDGEGDE